MSQRCDMSEMTSPDENVHFLQVKGYIHHERRLHRLLLQEVARQRDEHLSLQTAFDMASPSGQEEAPNVRFCSLIAFSVQSVWVVGVYCGMAEA